MKITDVVFTNHAIERMKERGISGDLAWTTIKKPNSQALGKEKSTTEFKKNFGAYTITAIGKKNDVGEWVVLSVWMDPPMKGTKDYNKRIKYLNKQEKIRSLDKKMEKASFWGKLWLTARRQIGI
jgi:hypothetical protein